MKIAIGGDVCVMQDCCEVFASSDASAAFGDIIPFFKSMDRVIVNLECAITDKDTAIKKIGPNLKSPFGTGRTLSMAGVTDCALSNNHIFDFGKTGVRDTLAELERFALGVTGFGENDTDARRNMIITDGKVRVAIIAVCEHEYSYALPDRMGARAYDPYDTNDDIAEAKRDADYVIVLYHGGKEHSFYPSPRLHKLCRSMVRHGADVVLCQHSHCIGCYENYEGGHILYGQGNFHFVHDEWIRENPEWGKGLIVSLDLGKKCDIELIPVVVEGKGIRLARDEEKRDILDAMEKRNISLKDGTFKERFTEFCNSVSQVYSFIPNDISDMFSHYLDCESHTDVWRELYKTWNHTNEK